MKTAQINPAPGHGTKCLKCGVGKMVTRIVSKGDKAGMVFLGCNNWRPNDETSCRHTIWPAAAAPAAEKQTPKTSRGRKCPKCQTGSLRERQIKKGDNEGKTFWSCDNWRPNDDTSCDYKEWPKLPAPAYKYKPKPAPRYRPPRPRF
ncbi:topoisomerase DNA-binding C4 zinc finger domain-containing protein [Pseudorhizobium flavum]|uniref:topoisomerase DNA-binding C4 zinc finger domain-containing protein n=1 Tax=Pseudorhizobium flavum TaxID=1335061 RepID=UPI00376FE951